MSEETQNTTALTVINGGKSEMALPLSNDFMFDAAAFDQAWRAAKAFASSDLLPVMFKDKPQNTFLALHMAHNLKVDAFMLMQNMFIVHGKPGLEGKLVIALLNSRGPYPTGVKFKVEGAGETLAVTASGTRRNGETDYCTVSIAMAKQMGWLKNEHWRSMPEQMACYRAATWLVRRHCPEVLMGLQTVEELKDAGGPIGVTVMPKEQSTGSQELNAIVTEG